MCNFWLRKFIFQILAPDEYCWFTLSLSKMAITGLVHGSFFVPETHLISASAFDFQEDFFVFQPARKTNQFA